MQMHKLLKPLLLFTSEYAYAQDIHLSQFFNTPWLQNPALAGVFTGDVRIRAVYRNQWQSVGFPYQINALRSEYKFGVVNADDFMMLGTSVFYDEARVMKLNTMQIMADKIISPYQRFVSANAGYF